MTASSLRHHSKPHKLPKKCHHPLADESYSLNAVNQQSDIAFKDQLHS